MHPVKFFEPLEHRQLMSASLVNGQLTVIGIDASDQIRIDVAANGILFVDQNGARQAFSTYETRSIALDARGGNDRVEVTPNVRQPTTLSGGTGNDTLIGGSGADAFIGGDGTDLADYSARTSNLTVSIDDRANDGAPGEGDDVRTDVENVRTGSGNDRVTGSSNDDALFTGAGHDTVRGGGGNDLISAGDGNDLVWGESEPSRFATPKGTAAVTKISSAAILKRISFSNTVRSGAGLSIFKPIDIGLIVAKPIRGGSVIGSKLSDIDLVRRNYCDTILAGAGNDTVHGGDGDDDIWGGTDNDRLHGDAGDNTVRGDAGNDELFAGAGRDQLFGGAGADILTAIGGGSADKLYGEAGGDQFWLDETSTEYCDADLAERMFGAVHRVGSFANGVTRELDGQNLRDPSGYDIGEPMMLGDEVDPQWKNFRDNPLFGPRGPLSSDVRQGQVTDGHLMDVFAGLAKHDPHRIRTSIADLGDGTYAVKLLGNDGAPRYYRVDGDLPVHNDGSPYYAGLGHGGATWVAIMEKAFAIHRGTGGTYRSLSGTRAGEAFAAFGMKADASLSIGQNAWMAIDWFQAQLKQGRVITVQVGGAPATKGAPILSHQLYVVESVNVGTAMIRSGDRLVPRVMPLTVTLRNPWGTDGAGNDGSDDGLVTLNFDHLNSNPMFAQAWV